MLLSNPTGKNGLLQEIEFWTNLGDGVVTNDASLRAVFVNRLDRAYDGLMPILLSYGDTMRWDDSVNHTDHPVATFDIVADANDYEFLSDETGNSILNVVSVSILPGATATEFVPLRRMTLDDPGVQRAMSPNPSDLGIPSAFLERNNTVFFDTLPGFAKEAGGKLYFERSPNYFATAEFGEDGHSERTPGIPEPFHPVLAMGAALDWLCVNKPESGFLISRLDDEIKKAKRSLELLIAKKHPTRRRLTGHRTQAV